MKVQKYFVGLLLALIILTISWYVVLFQPLSREKTDTRLKLAGLSSQLVQAHVAEKDLESIKDRVAEKEDEIADVKSHFVDKNDLSMVMKSVRDMAAQFDLDVTDFSPVLDSYFNKETKGNIKPLPILITVTGRYIRVGKFVENWHKLPFYLVPDAFEIEKNKDANELKVTITTNLYTLNQ